MKKHIFTTVVILFAGIILSACGSATAPPVELPAPVVGRITVGTPDSSGKSTITGTAGAVTGGATVMAVNDRLASSSALWKITDKLVSTAHAQTSGLPSVCDATGHYCVLADEDGSFTLVVDAVIGDILTLGLIDDLGEWISERITLVVPATSLEYEVSCGGLGLDGGMAGLFNADGVPIELYRGSDEQNNKLKIGANEYDLPGCYAYSLDVVSTTSIPNTKVLMASKEDKIIWVGDLSGTLFTTANTFTLEDTPIGIASIGSFDYAAVALQTSSGPAIGRLSLNDGTVDNVVSVPLPATYTFLDALPLRVYGSFADGASLGVFVYRGQSSNSIDSFVYLFETGDFANATLSGVPIDLSSLIFASSENILDARLYISDLSTKEIVLFLADYENRLVRMLRTMVSGAAYLYQTDTIRDKFNKLYLEYTSAISDMTISTTAYPKRLDVGHNTNVPVVYSLIDDTSNDDKFASIEDPGVSKLVTRREVSDSPNPLFIAVDSQFESIILGDVDLNMALSLDSSYWVN